MSQSSQRRPLRLLDDTVPATEGADLLEHRAIAASIASAIRHTETQGSLGIALFGSWGHGKSTIGALVKDELQKEIRSKRLAWVPIDAWKYARAPDEQPLRRHYLLQAYESI